MKILKRKNKKPFILVTFKLFKENGWIKVDTPVEAEGFEEELSDTFHSMLRVKTETGKCFLDTMYNAKLNFNKYEIIFREK